jgi:ABC-type transport system substrate-binding protein
VEDRRVRVLEKVPGYWRGAGVSEDQSAAISVRREYDDTDQSAQERRGARRRARAVGQSARAQGRPSLRLNQVLGNGYEHVTLNEKHFPPFADVRVRRALAHCDRSRPARENDSRQSRDGVNGPIQPLSWAYEPNVPTYEFSPRSARAARLAGWKPGADGIRVKDGKPLAFT